MPVQSISEMLRSIEAAKIRKRLYQTEQQIEQLEATIAALSAAGHEVSDAKKFLQELLIALAGLHRASFAIDEEVVGAPLSAPNVGGHLPMRDRF